MTKKEIINAAIANNEITLDTAAQILLGGNEAVKAAAKAGEITADLAGQIIMAPVR